MTVSIQHDHSPLSCRYIIHLRRSYTFSDLFPDVTRLIIRNMLIHSPGYIGEFEEVDDHRSGKIVIQLNGR